MIVGVVGEPDSVADSRICGAVITPDTTTGCTLKGMNISPAWAVVVSVMIGSPRKSARQVVGTPSRQTSTENVHTPEPDAWFAAE